MEIILFLGVFIVGWCLTFLITYVIVAGDSDMTKDRKNEVLIISFIEAIFFLFLYFFID